MISPRTAGRVIAKNSFTGPAPSSRAASNSSAGMRLIPDSISSITSPISTQVPMKPTDASAVPGSPSQPRVRPPSPTASSTWFSGPTGE